MPDTNPIPGKNTPGHEQWNDLENQPHPADPNKLPGEGQPNIPGGVPWIPKVAPQVYKHLPGWWGVFQENVKALVQNPNFDPKGGLDESLLKLAEQLTDHMMQHFQGGTS